ncbi:MAG: FAD-dependent oxidoreductase [Phycisphaera sp.]|nr:FAD-dependent oxidoreductase [Phycisphaera sp.]
MRIDVLIFGGGVAGLWLLDELVRSGYSAVLVESRALGAGQTVASQGILHGGLKYTLKGAFNNAAKEISQMPARWAEHLRGERKPDLSRVVMRSGYCHLWRTGSLSSRVGMVGARVGLAVKPIALEQSDWPEWLKHGAGEVYRLDEQVVSPPSLVRELAVPHLARTVHAPEPVKWIVAGEDVKSVRIGGVTFDPACVVLCAGEGNEALRNQLGKPSSLMQRRPRQMVLVHSTSGRNLQWVNGHCTDTSRTRLTITSDRDSMGRVVWQIGGAPSEDGPDWPPRKLIEHTSREVRACLPGVDLTGCEWATYHVNIAESATPTGLKPDGVFALREGNLVTAWPTKLALVPVMVERVMGMLDQPQPSSLEAHRQPELERALTQLPRPAFADPPWETISQWMTCP